MKKTNEPERTIVLDLPKFGHLDYKDSILVFLLLNSITSVVNLALEHGWADSSVLNRKRRRQLHVEYPVRQQCNSYGPQMLHWRHLGGAAEVAPTIGLNAHRSRSRAWVTQPPWRPDVRVRAPSFLCPSTPFTLYCRFLGTAIVPTRLRSTVAGALPCSPVCIHPGVARFIQASSALRFLGRALRSENSPRVIMSSIPQSSKRVCCPRLSASLNPRDLGGNPSLPT